jgi:voltage-gated sodium channel
MDGVTPLRSDFPAAGLRARAAAFVTNPRVERFVIALILVNAITLGLETSPTVMAAAGGALLAIDRVILAVFVVELLLKQYALGLRFWRNPWNVFDAAVVGIALMPSAGPLAVLRSLRVLRLLRLVSVVPRMRAIIESVFRALPGLGTIGVLLVLFFYVFAVMGTKLFGAEFPQWFGTLPRSMFTLFQVMTLESWTGIARSIKPVYPLAWLYFLSFILLATFTILNLFIAIIVNAMQSQHEAPASPPAGDAVLRELQQLRLEVAGLRRSLRSQQPPPPRRRAGSAGRSTPRRGPR